MYYNNNNRSDDSEMNSFREVKPEFYIHLAIIKCQQALQNPDTNQGVPAYSFYVQHIETLCYAADMLPKNYDEEVKRNAAELANEGYTTKEFLIKDANYRLKILLAKIFKNRDLVRPMFDTGVREMKRMSNGELPPITNIVEEIEKADIDDIKDIDDYEDDGIDEIEEPEKVET
jgi:hypothetical protein